MKLQDIKALRAYSETFWKASGDNPVSHRPKHHVSGHKGLLIENYISGTWDTDSSNMGQKVRRFRAFTENNIWSHWRVGIPVKYKGKAVVLWVRAYHCQKGEPIMWLQETIWMIDTGKEMRKSAQDKCWEYMMAMSARKSADVSDMRLRRWQRVGHPDGWRCEHNGVWWQIYPNVDHWNIVEDKDGKRTLEPVISDEKRYWVQHQSSNILAHACDTLKDAKMFIKNQGASWMASRKYYSIL